MWVMPRDGWVRLTGVMNGSDVIARVKARDGRMRRVGRWKMKIRSRVKECVEMVERV